MINHRKSPVVFYIVIQKDSNACIVDYATCYSPKHAVSRMNNENIVNSINSGEYDIAVDINGFLESVRNAPDIGYMQHSVSESSDMTMKEVRAMDFKNLFATYKLLDKTPVNSRFRTHEKHRFVETDPRKETVHHKTIQDDVYYPS